MPDQPATYSDPSGAMITLDSARGWGKPEHVHLSIVAPAALDRLGLLVPTARLLAMIDAEDPEAMRAYLRETSEPTGHTVRVTPEQLDSIPEADSPEDVMPDHIDPTERAQIDRAWAMERAAEVLSRLVAVTGAEGGTVPVIGYASWILTGSTETLDR